MHQEELLACQASLTSRKLDEINLLKVNVWCYLQFEIQCGSVLHNVEGIYCPGLLPYKMVVCHPVW